MESYISFKRDLWLVDDVAVFFNRTDEVGLIGNRVQNNHNVACCQGGVIGS